jgi:murein DD-endopeptidase MepM/ murein hydrolase activator NlpD
VYIGDTIRAAWSGKVRIVKYEGAGYGKYVVIRHNNGLETIYGHMSAWLVEENQTVKAGQPIGLGGNTGRSTGSHLHFETRLCGVALNPAIFFDFRNQDVVADYYMFRKSTYEREAIAANALRGKIGNGGYSASDVRGETMPGGGAVAQQSAPANRMQNAEIRYHKVAAGETLYRIAKRRGLTVDELCKLNHLSKDVKVRPGQLLRYS